VVVGSYSCLTALAEDLIGQSALEWGKRHVILSIIDSQPSAIDPAFIHANETPDFAEESVLDRTLDAEISPEAQEARDHAQRCSST
jgi:hypothetical protein